MGKNARKSAKSLKGLQSVLGDHHDAVIASQALRQLALRAYAAGRTRSTTGCCTNASPRRGYLFPGLCFSFCVFVGPGEVRMVVLCCAEGAETT